MCFSASVSYSSSAVLVATGLYAVRQSRRLTGHTGYGRRSPSSSASSKPSKDGYGRCSKRAILTLRCRMLRAFHFFSHFLWLWWFGLGAYFVEPGKIRKRIIGACTLFGVFAGTLVYAVILSHPEWMLVSVREHSVVYKFSVPYRDSIHLPVTPAGLYALTVLVPLFFSSHRHIKIFGGLVVLSSLLASEIYGYAYVSVWCFFAALLSLYLVYMIQYFVAESKLIRV